VRSQVQLLLGPPILTVRPNGAGALAQLVEHLLCKQGVNGSNPLSSTIFWISRDEDKIFRCLTTADLADLPPFFDIVNGFFNRCRGGMYGYSYLCVLLQIKIDYLAEIISSALPVM
jgi:hypothetical protein